MTFRFVALTALLALVSLATTAQADPTYPGVGYYISRDANPTLGSDPNPNYGRLTFLYNHGNHFHSIGRFGGGANELPESYQGPDARIDLFLGSGDHAGRFVSSYYNDDTPGSEYSDLRIDSIRNLSGFEAGSAEEILFSSSNRRYVSGPENASHPLSLEGSLVAFEIVELSSGLNAVVGDQIGSQVGDLLTLGAGDSLSTLLTFMTDTGVGHFIDMTAVLRLVDLSTGGTPLGSSGDIRFNLRTTPEPSTYLMFGLGLASVAGLRFRTRRRRLAIG